MNKLEIRYLYRLVALLENPTMQQAVESLGMMQSLPSFDMKWSLQLLFNDIKNKPRAMSLLRGSFYNLNRLLLLF